MTRDQYIQELVRANSVTAMENFLDSLLADPVISTSFLGMSEMAQSLLVELIGITAGELASTCTAQALSEYKE